MQEEFAAMITRSVAEPLLPRRPELHIFLSAFSKNSRFTRAFVEILVVLGFVHAEGEHEFEILGGQGARPGKAGQGGGSKGCGFEKGSTVHGAMVCF
jgi:hypothetical protein